MTTTLTLVLVAVLGLVMGSFINCWAWRTVHGESIMKGRSHCATCNHELAPRDLIPVVSWLISGGKCRYCGEKISARYPITEVITALGYCALFLRFGFSLETVELMAFSSILLFLSLTDLDDYLIPNGCIIAAIAVRVVYLAAAWALGIMQVGDIIYYVASGFGVGIALLVVVLVADFVAKRDTMGGGDLKLYFVAGLYFGAVQMIFVVIASCVIGLVVALLGPKPDDEESAMKRVIPFGPSIAAACFITMLAGEPLVSWYFSLL